RHHRRPDCQPASHLADHARGLRADGQAAQAQPRRTPAQPHRRRAANTNDDMNKHPILRRAAAAAAISTALAALSGCALTPAYEVPTTPQPSGFKEAQGWQPAAPADALERGPWWELF